jgi:DNA-binding transcriptional MerR regulator
MDAALLTIGQLARRHDLNPSALRYYEREGLLQPTARSAAGYRLYGADAERTLRTIRRAQRLGFSLADVADLLAADKVGDLGQATLTRLAEARYLDLARQLTALQVLQHELGQFLQDMRAAPDAGFDRLLARVCAAPGAQPPQSLLDWLVEYTGCILDAAVRVALLAQLQGAHVHLWETEDGYDILIVSDDPALRPVLEALAEMETRCQAHAHTPRGTELAHDDEGYLLHARGDHAFIFAQFFLALALAEGA